MLTGIVFGLLQLQLQLLTLGFLGKQIAIISEVSTIFSTKKVEILMECAFIKVNISAIIELVCLVALQHSHFEQQPFLLPFL